MWFKIGWEALDLIDYMLICSECFVRSFFLVEEVGLTIQWGACVGCRRLFIS